MQKSHSSIRTAMKTTLFILLCACFVLTLPACDSADRQQAKLNELYTPALLGRANFAIDPTLDNIITGLSGTIVRIGKNSFVDSNGVLLKTTVVVEVKECLSKVDRINGNMLTLFEGKPLESGGMLYLSANADSVDSGKRLQLAPGKQLYISMPTDSVLTGMALFEGEETANGVSWSNPVALPEKGSKEDTEIMSQSFEKTTNIMYRVDGFEDATNAPMSVQDEVGRIAWMGDGLKIQRDSVFKIGIYTVRFIKQKTLERFNYTETYEKGKNTYTSDKNTAYIFSVKKLGWANIDRLLDDPRTKEVEMITDIENKDDFKVVYVTMVTARMYLPGYEKKDGTYSFTHGDEEKPKLPVGETATVLATAYSGDKVFFGLSRFVIGEKQKISFRLEETDKMEMATKLEAAL